MELKEILKDYDELYEEYVTSYILKLDNGSEYNIEKHNTTFNGSVFVFETTKNKYHNVSILEKLKSKLDNDLYDECNEDKEIFMYCRPDECYEYDFTTYRSEDILNELFDKIILALDEINKGV